ncbi:MAG: methyltransferase domain-containing protein, partial [Pseudomonadota bacterium]|nr:methyltransferase domain-containing protein [Pseudomonadota bacterium]
IFAILNEQSYSVQELCQLFDVRQPNMSHHLKLLNEQGLIAAHKEGNRMYYAQAVQFPEQVEVVVEALRAQSEQWLLPEVVLEQAQLIDNSRAQSSQQFFEKNSETFQQNQELIVAASQYYPTVLELVKSLGLSVHAKVAEVGVGEGGFLTQLLALFESVTAVEYAPVMLAKAKAQLEQEGLAERIHWVQADIQRAQTWQFFDAIVLNMVLHHLPSPAQAIKNMAKMLALGGVIVLCDLVQHEQAWAQTHCGDLWMGFDPEQLHRWMRQQGLIHENLVFSGLRNGFQVFYSVYRKPQAVETQKVVSAR